jgi:hypothetical protein
VSEDFEKCVTTLKRVIGEARGEDSEAVEWLEAEELEILTGQSFQDVTKMRQGEWPRVVKTPYGERNIVIKLTAEKETLGGLITAGDHYFVECTEKVGSCDMVLVHDSLSCMEDKVQDRLVEHYKKKDVKKPLLPRK